MLQNLDASSPYYHHDVLTSSSESCSMAANSTGSSLSDFNLIDGLLLWNGSSASQRYLPNEHHRIIGGQSGGLDVNAIQPTAPHLVPAAYRHCAEDRCSGGIDMVPLKQSVGCEYKHASHNIGGIAHSSMCQMPSGIFPNEFFNGRQTFMTNTEPAIDVAAAREGCMYSHPEGDMRLMPGCNLFTSANSNTLMSLVGSRGIFENLNMAGCKTNFAANSGLMYPQLSLQTPQQSLVVAESLMRPSNMDALSPYLSQEQLSICRKQQEFQQFLNGPHTPRRQSDQIPLWQTEQYYQQHASLENRTHPNCNFDGFIQSKGYQVPHEFRTMHEVASQHPFLQGCARNLRCASNRVAASCGSRIISREMKHVMQRRILFLYIHAMNCASGEKECENSCWTMKSIINHISRCTNSTCTDSHCAYKELLTHYQECCERNCAVCGPVKLKLENYPGVTCSSLVPVSKVVTPIGTVEHHQSPSKRMKIEHPSRTSSCKSDTSYESLPVTDHMFQLQPRLQEYQLTPSLTMTAESMKLHKKSSSSYTVESNAKLCEAKFNHPVMDTEVKLNVKPGSSGVIVAPGEEQVPMEPGSVELVAKCEISASVIDTEVKLNVEPGSSGVIVELSEEEQIPMEPRNVELEAICEISTSDSAHDTRTELEKQLKGISLIHSFTPEIIREHLRGLRQFACQSKGKADKSQVMEHLINNNSCSLCGMEDLRFEQPAKFCMLCPKPITKAYYSLRSVDTTANDSDAWIFCSTCYNASGEKSIKVGDRRIPKANLERRLTYAETDAEMESFVQCDKCKAWQHQICALFNAKRNITEKTGYTCPTCFLEEVESGDQIPLPQGTFLGAKDLQRTVLSDHLEEWLFRRLKEERQERANSLGMNFDEVPTAQDLVVRVVSSVGKNLKVEPLFREIFEEDNYPSEFSYRSKAILLFQKIEGADVCLFAMYVHEFGSDCASPNKRRVCLSYLDSVNYFQPEVRTVTGEALRTFVYQEILIGYLDYCKTRGFTSCYIWACAYEKGREYILSCHPPMQKIPDDDRLHEWYHKILRKAIKDNIVVGHTTIHDHFFLRANESKAMLTAARLPYFDGDQLTLLISKFLHEKTDKLEKKKVIERAIRAARRDASTGNPKDIWLMYKLKEEMRKSRKENFIIVHLQHNCRHCSDPILSTEQWVCNVCKNFRLCEECYSIEEDLEQKDRHPVSAKNKHLFHKIVEENVRADTVDEDLTIQSDIFDSRLVFLSFCKGNQYQFNSLRRAKHSTMMILYHLHNPAAPAYISSCDVCHNNIDKAQAWCCMSCPGYDVCNSCYQKQGAALHDHELIRTSKTNDHNLQADIRNMQDKGLKIVLAALVHASQCRVPRCTFQFCRKIKGLFHHGTECQTRSKGGCDLCSKIWIILQLHARDCNELECHVPRCKDLKEHMRKRRFPSESYLSAEVNERVRLQESQTS